jgi:hypothetical protein
MKIKHTVLTCLPAAGLPFPFFLRHNPFKFCGIFAPESYRDPAPEKHSLKATAVDNDKRITAAQYDTLYFFNVPKQFFVLL